MDGQGDRLHHTGLLLNGVGACILALGLSLSLPLMTAGMALGLLGLILARQRPPLAPLLLVAGLAAWMALGQWQTGSDGRWGLAYAALALFPVRAAAMDAAWRKRLLWCLVIGASASALLAMVQFLWGYDVTRRPWRIDANGDARFGRVSGFFAVHLTQGYAMGSVALMLLLPRVRTGLGLVGTGLGRCAAGTGLLLCQARSAWLGAAAAAVVALAGSGRRKRLAGAGILAGILVAGAGLLALANPGLLQRTLAGDASRWFIWGTAVEAVAERPVFGLGDKNAFADWHRERLASAHPERLLTLDPNDPEPALQRWPALRDDERIQTDLRLWRDGGGWKTLEQIEHDLDHVVGIVTGNAAWFPAGAPHAHHSLLGIASLHGLPAAALWLALLAWCLGRAWQRRRADPQAAGLVMGAVAMALVAGQFEYYAGDTESAYALWLACGLGLGLLAEQAAEPEVPEEDLRIMDSGG